MVDSTKQSRDRSFILSVDVEDWYASSVDLFKEARSSHGLPPDPSVVPNSLACLDLLKRTGNTATFFILTTVCEHYPDLVREIKHQGHEIGVHGYLHKLIYRMSPTEFEDDLKKSLELLSNTGLDCVSGFRAPYWSITRDSLWAIDILQRNGLKYDSSIFPIRRGLYGIHDAPTEPYEIAPGFWELPPATHRFLGQNIPIAGGGYLRTLPFWLILRLIQKAGGRDKHRMFYFHPYELSPGDTRPKHRLRSMSSLVYFLQQTVGRKGNRAKLERLLGEFKFSSVEKAFPQIAG